jgi:hypothetical protein
MSVIDVTERPVLLLGWPDPDRVLEPAGIVSGLVVGSPAVVLVMSPTAIAGNTVAGSPALTVSLSPDGIAGSEAFGTAQADAQVDPTGIPSGAAVGPPEAFTSMNPTGFTSAGSVGSPSLTATMAPTGIASAVQFGDADTLATVFIIPGPVDPSNDFGNAVATKKGWIFRPPVSTYQWRLFKEYEGISLLKENGTWTEVAHPDLERTRNADKYLGGGRDHVVSTSLKAELEGLGYTVTEEIVTTERYLS